jgi:hypothetical protein
MFVAWRWRWLDGLVRVRMMMIVLLIDEVAQMTEAARGQARIELGGAW